MKLALSFSYTNLPKKRIFLVKIGDQSRYPPSLKRYVVIKITKFDCYIFILTYKYEQKIKMDIV